jgi:hypothetical protein
MRAAICAAAAAIVFVAGPQSARGDAAAFWKGVRANCAVTAAGPVGEFGRRIARIATDEFYRFGGHEIDANGRMFRFGLTEAEHQAEVGPTVRRAPPGQLGWWRVMKYWRALYGEAAAAKLEARGYRDASTATQGGQETPLLRTTAAQLLGDAENLSDPTAREILREAALRAAVVDTPWSAAFVSYVLREAGATESQFRFSNAHRDYIYDAFATSAAELAGIGGHDRLYRACPLAAAEPRPGDLICAQYEPALADAGAAAVRERIRTELDDGAAARSVRRTHCEVVVHVDAPARKVYTISGNVYQAVAARKMNLRDDLKFSPVQNGRCGNPGDWTLPPPSAAAAGAPGLSKRCSLNDEKWFVLLQLR